MSVDYAPNFEMNQHVDRTTNYRNLTVDDIEEIFSTQPVAKSIDQRLYQDFLKIKPSNRTLSNRRSSSASASISSSSLNPSMSSTSSSPHLVLDGALVPHRHSWNHNSKSKSKSRSRSRSKSKSKTNQKKQKQKQPPWMKLLL